MNLQKPQILRVHWAASNWVQSLISDGYIVIVISEDYVKLRHLRNGNFASVSVRGSKAQLTINGKVSKVCQY